MFEQSFVTVGKTRRPLMFGVGFVVEACITSALFLIPLLVVETLPQRDLFRALLLAPVPMAAPQPVPPVPVAVKVVRPAAPRRFDPAVLVAPAVVPKTAAIIVDPPQLAQYETVAGGVPGGIPGALPGGVMNGVLNASIAPPPPPPPVGLVTPPPPPAVPPRIDVGGNVQAALLVHQPAPSYPARARQARIEGVVKLKAVIGTDGRIRNLAAVSGQPFLVEAALTAVQQWVYQPTVLNGVPVEVNTVIEVRFALQR